MVKNGNSSRYESYLFWCLLVAIGLIFASLARPLLTRTIYVADDMKNGGLPIVSFYSKALASGDGFLWAPQFYCGFYLHGMGHGGLTHPFRWLCYRFLPLDVALNITFLATYGWAFLGMFLMLRHWRISRNASLFGAMLYAFCGFNLFHFMHFETLAVPAHIPWLLWMMDIVFRSTDRKRVAVALLAISLLTASQVLLAHPEFWYHSLLAEGVFALWHMRTWQGLRRMPLLVLSKAMGVAIAAIQLLPTWEYYWLSSRSTADMNFRFSFSLHPANLLQFFAPLMFRERYYASVRWLDGNTWEMGLYFGAFSTVALAWLWVRRKALRKDFPGIRPLLVAAAIVLLIALGKYGLVYQVFATLPVVQGLRCACRHIMLVHLAMPILASIVLMDMVRVAEQGIRIPWRNVWPLAVPAAIAGVSAAVACWILGQARHPWAAELSSVPDVLFGLGLMVGATALVVAAARGIRFAVPGIVAFTLAEILIWGVLLYVWRLGEPKTLDAVMASLPKAPTQEGRICFPGPPGNLFALGGADLMDGYFAMLPKKNLPLDLNSLRLAAVHWVPINDRWAAVPAPMPRCWLVSRCVVDQDAASAVRRVDIATTAVVDRSVELTPGEPGTATIQARRPERIEVEVSAPTRQLLVLSESYYPGWTARSNGKPLPVIRAYGDFMACAVEPGHSHIVFCFEPVSFRRGAWVTLFSLAAALMTFALVFWLPAKPSAPGGKKEAAKDSAPDLASTRAKRRRHHRN